MLEAPALGEPGRDRMRNPSGLAPALYMGISRATIKERRRGVVGPENLRRPLMLKISFRTAILRPYEPHFIFRDRFPDERLPLPSFPTA